MAAAGEIEGKPAPKVHNLDFIIVLVKFTLILVEFILIVKIRFL